MLEYSSKMEGAMLFGFSSVILLQYLRLLHEKFHHDQLQVLLQRQMRLREEERQGRIALQKENRKQMISQVQESGYSYRPIGFIQSPFHERRGTPRQPLLVTAAKGYIRFHRSIIQYAHYEELKEFSHIWVLFVFHENTNLEKDGKGQLTVPAKIKPPRLHGKKVGTLSTRSPHRPNNLGLSICEILEVTSAGIKIQGLDLVDGTPVLDIKPVIPYDLMVPSSHYTLPMIPRDVKTGLAVSMRPLRVPEWIVESDIPLLPVSFSQLALKGLEEIYEGGGHGQGKHLCETAEEAQELIRQVLRQDIRSTHQGRGGNGGNNSSNHSNNSSLGSRSSHSSNGHSQPSNSSNSNSSGGVTTQRVSFASPIISNPSYLAFLRDSKNEDSTEEAASTSDSIITNLASPTNTPSIASIATATSAGQPIEDSQLQSQEQEYSCCIDHCLIHFQYQANQLLVTEISEQLLSSSQSSQPANRATSSDMMMPILPLPVASRENSNNSYTSSTSFSTSVSR